MSEETQNEGTISGLKKTIIGTLTTVIGGAGIWVSTTLFGGHSEDKEEVKTEQVAPAPAPVVINLQNNNTNQQKQQSNNSNSNNVKQQAAPVAPAPAPVKKEEESW
jgi:flagellar basal body-associated protein FliL